MSEIAQTVRRWWLRFDAVIDRWADRDVAKILKDEEPTCLHSGR